MRRQNLIFLTYLYDDYENFSSALGHNSWANAQFDGTSGKSNACAGPVIGLSNVGGIISYETLTIRFFSHYRALAVDFN